MGDNGNAYKILARNRDEKRLLRGCTRLYPKVSGLAAWSENCKWYSSLPPDAGVSLFCETV